MGLRLRWQGRGIDEVGIVDSLGGSPQGLAAPDLLGKTIVAVDPRYFRPTEVETLLGDPTNARTKLGWSPRIPFADMVAEMVGSDLEGARRDGVLEREGFRTNRGHE